MRRLGGIRVTAALAALALMAVGCGARLSAEELAALRTRQASVGRQGEVAASTTTTTSAATTDTGAATGGGQGGGGRTGGGGQASGPSGGGAPSGPGGAACASSGQASDVGVTGDRVRIGAVATLTGPVPGLSQTMINGVKAYVAFVNSQGGVCGRGLDLAVADDRLDAGVNRSETQRLAQEVFAFVGGWSVVDDGGAAVLQGTNIPDISLALGDARRALPNGFSTNPIDPNADSNGTARMMQYFAATYGVRTGAIVYPAQSVARNAAFRYGPDMAAAGIELVEDIQVAITQTDYNGVASQLKNANVDLVITTLENNGIARLAQAFQQQGWFPKVPFYGAQAYHEELPAKAGPALNGAILGLAYGIVEDAGSNPAMQTFVDWYRRVNPGQPIDFFAMQGWAAGAMFVQALAGAGPSPTRDAVLAQLQGITSFDAGGIIAPVNPAQKQPPSCFMVVTVENQQWRRLHPGSGFDCG